jgi:5-(carboxyamino)imidazole ribonucleotide synthase
VSSKYDGDVIVPGATIGILGGGQLGRMMALAGRPMGYRFVCLGPKPDSSAAQACDEHILAEYDDVEGARKLVEMASVITYEFENIAPAVAAVLEDESYLPQGTELLRITRHRAREKRAIIAAGAQVAPFAEIGTGEEFDEALDEVGAPSVLKTATGGYDGKGQRVIKSKADGEKAYEELADQGDLVLEKFVDFQCELSVVVARSTNGESATFPVAENIHVDNRLHLSIAPARVGEEVKTKVSQMAVSIADSLGMVGLLGIEFFLGRDGEIYVNEMAPRPHNSGHYTMDACLTSQFEQHLRAICGLPLGNPDQHTPVVMANLLGQHVEPWLEQMSKRRPPNLELKTHLYGKSPARKGRKMGHVNVLAEELDEALQWVESCSVWSDLQS